MDNFITLWSYYGNILISFLSNLVNHLCRSISKTREALKQQVPLIKGKTSMGASDSEAKPEYSQHSLNGYMRRGLSERDIDLELCLYIFQQDAYSKRKG